MATSNIVRDQSSSSSSNEDESKSTGLNGTYFTGIIEEHKKKSCKYEKYEDVTKDGITIYMHVRVCNCKSDYEDRSYLADDKMDFLPMDGKEIHLNRYCKWRRRPIKRGTKTYYIHEKYCSGCTSPLTNSTVSAMNMIPPSH